MLLNQNDPSKTIILAGSGRSGTTWLSNIIAANPNVDIIFEPFDPRRVPQAKALPMFAYARPQEEHPEWYAFVKDVLTNKVQNEWTTQQRRRTHLIANRLLLKAIRINHLLPWIDAQFNPKIVFTIRHPCAVILSRIKLNWDTHLDLFTKQQTLVADYLEPHLDLIHSAKTEIERQAIGWCIENIVPLKMVDKYNWLFCTYEQLYENTESEAERILAHLEIKESWFTRRELNRISVVTRPDSAIHSGNDPLAAWKQQLSIEDQNTILEIVGQFGIELYDDGRLPNLNKLTSVNI